MTTRWLIAPEAAADLERLTDFLLQSAPEIVISRGRTGYLALYRYDAQADVALVLALRHQRENGYH